MSDPDFGGLRTAVEDAAVPVPFLTLRDRAARRRRRWLGSAAAGTAAVVVLAVLALPRPGPAPDPALEPTPPPAPPAGQLIDTAFGRTTAYALLGSCEPAGTGCRYELLSSGDEGRSWTRLRSPVPPPAPDDGFSAELLVTGDDDLTVRDPARDRVHTSTDRGRTFTARALRPGPALDAVPPGLRVEQTWCGGDPCGPSRLVVLDPATGRQSPLRAQPLPRSTLIDVATGDDGRIWVAGPDGDRVVSAVSRDRGRTWRQLPALTGPPVVLLHLVPLPGADAGAYLLTGRRDRSDAVLNVFSDLWRLDGAGWTRVTPRGAPRSALTAVGLSDGELLLTTEEGGTWRTSGRGTRIARDPAGGALAVLRRSGPLLVGWTGAGELLVSADDGRSWEPRPVVVR